MPSAPDNPLARLGVFGSAGHLGDNIVPSARAAQIEAQPEFADAHEVSMAFDEPRNGRHAL